MEQNVVTTTPETPEQTPVITEDKTVVILPTETTEEKPKLILKFGINQKGIDENNVLSNEAVWLYELEDVTSADLCDIGGYLGRQMFVFVQSLPQRKHGYNFNFYINDTLTVGVKAKAKGSITFRNEVDCACGILAILCTVFDRNYKQSITGFVMDSPQISKMLSDIGVNNTNISLMSALLALDIKRKRNKLGRKDEKKAVLIDMHGQDWYDAMEAKQKEQRDKAKAKKEKAKLNESDKFAPDAIKEHQKELEKEHQAA